MFLNIKVFFGKVNVGKKFSKVFACREVKEKPRTESDHVFLNFHSMASI